MWHGARDAIRDGDERRKELSGAAKPRRAWRLRLTSSVVRLVLVLIGLADTIITQVTFSAYAASGGGASKIVAPPSILLISLFASAYVGLTLAMTEARHGERATALRRRKRTKKEGQRAYVAIRERLRARRKRLEMAGSAWMKQLRTAGMPLTVLYRWSGAFSVWSVVGVWLAVLALAVSLVADLGTVSPASRPAAQWAWVASVALLVVAAAVIEHGRRLRRAEHPARHEAIRAQGPVPATSWTSARGWTGRAWRRWGDAALIGILTTGALALRLPDLTELPYVVHGDEASCGLEALRWLSGGVPSLLSTGWYGLPVAGYGLPALVMRFAGANLWGLRLSSVMIGTLSIALLYALAREFRSRRVAFLAAALMTVSHLHIQFSRMGIHYIHGLFVVLLVLWLLVRALRRGSLVAAVLAGAAMSFSLQVYFSARIVFVIVPLFLLGMALLTRKSPRPVHERWGSGEWLRPMGWLALGLLVAVGPLLVFFQQNLGALTGRPAEVLILNLTPYRQQTLHTQFGTTDLMAILGRQLAAVPLIPGGLADQSLQYGPRYAMLDPLVAALVLIGFWYAVCTLRRPLSLLLVIWVVSGVMLGGVLTIDLPWWPRLLAMLPALCLLAALALDGMLRMADRVVTAQAVARRVARAVDAWSAPAEHGRGTWRSPLRRGWSRGHGWRAVRAGLGALVVLCVVGYSLGETIQHYFVAYPKSVNTDTYRTRYTDLAYYAAALPAGTRVVIFDNGDLLLDYATIRLLAPELRGTRVTSAAELTRTLAERAGPVLVIVTLTNVANFESLLASPSELPPGSFQAVRNAFGVAAFYTYIVP